MILFVSQGLHLLYELDNQHKERSHVKYEVSGLKVPIPHVAETGKFDKQKFEDKFKLYKELTQDRVKEIVCSQIDRLINTIPESEHRDSEIQEVSKRILNIYVGEKHTSYIGEKWLTAILKLFEKSNFETRNYYKSRLQIDNLYDTTVKKSLSIIQLLQVMNNFKPDTIRKIVRDSVNVETNEEFSSLLKHNWINFSSVHVLHPDFLEGFGNEIMKEWVYARIQTSLID